MAGCVYGSGEVLSEQRLVLRAPPRSIRWEANQRKVHRVGNEAHIDSAAAVETTLRIAVIEVVYDPAHRDALEFVERMLEQGRSPSVTVEHQILSDLSAGVRQTVGVAALIGRQQELAPDIQNELADAVNRTAQNTGLLFNIALNYGGRAEIVDAVRKTIEAGVPASEIDERRFGEFLYTAGQPDPDLLIRTSGEMRVSNYLLWQIAYSEIYVTDTLWPDFRRKHLFEAVLAYQKRERRYGGISARAVIGAK